MDKAKEMKEEK